MAVEDSPILLPEGVSQRQIADAIGISISTVSRALSGNDKVSDRTRADVLRAIERLARPQDPTRAVKPARKVIGLTHSHLVEGPALRSLDIILEQVLGGAETAARKSGYLLYTLQNSQVLKGIGGDSFFDEVQGVITAGGLVSNSLIASIRNRDIPVVIIGGHLPGSDIPSVGAHSAEGIRSAVQHLVELGHRRIGLVNGPSDTYTSIEKRSGYLSGLAEAGIAGDLSLIRWHDGLSGFDVEDAIAMTGELLDLDDRPTGIVFASDGMALAGITACRARQLTVPDDISIVGFHDDPDAQLALPRLTTIRVDRLAWGAAGVKRMLAALSEGTSQADRLLLPTTLIVRDSTSPARAPKPGKVTS